MPLDKTYELTITLNSRTALRVIIEAPDPAIAAHYWDEKHFWDIAEVSDYMIDAIREITILEVVPIKVQENDK